MDRGFKKVIIQLSAVLDKDIGSILESAGMALISSMGGACGPLYGTLFMRAGMAASGKYELNTTDMAAVLRAGLSGLIERGKTKVGDKTMVDALAPGVEAFDEAVHVIDPHESIPNDWMVLMGADTHESLRNPQACVFIAVTPEDEFIIFDEILQPCLIPELADMINKKLDSWNLQGEYRFMVMDISQKSAVAGVRHDEILKRSGLKKIRIADKTKGSPQEGRSLIKDLLKWEQGDAGEWIVKPRFFVTENCVNVRREMKRYMYDEWAGKTKDKRDPKEEVRKRDDHLMDAIRYVIQENIKYRTKGFRVNQPDAKSKHLIRGVSFKSKDEVDEKEWQTLVGIRKIKMK